LGLFTKALILLFYMINFFFVDKKAHLRTMLGSYEGVHPMMILDYLSELGSMRNSLTYLLRALYVKRIIVCLAEP
jgi:hypothetical protein